MKLSEEWLAYSGLDYLPEAGRTGYAHLKHYTAKFCEWGSGPPLVLVPGLAGGYPLLGPLARCLAVHFRVISYELRGEDDCFALRQQFGLTDLVADLEEFLSWHSLEKPAVFGVSFGGMIALELAARYRQRIDRLVVQGAGARFERGLLQQIASLVLSQYPLPADNPFVNQFFNLFFGRKQSPSPLFEFATRQCWRTDQSVMAHRFRMVEQYDLRPRLKQIRVPTLILAGERDMLVSQRSLQALSEGVAESRLVRLPGSGHLAFLSEPERIAEEAHSFLRP